MKTLEEYKTEIEDCIISEFEDRFSVINKVDDVLSEIFENSHGYSFFLFSKLWDLEYDSSLEYDDMYPIVKKSFEEYNRSGFNDSNMSEYECMERYLHFESGKE